MGTNKPADSSARQYLSSLERLIVAVQNLSLARELKDVVEIVRHAARELTGADGATFILREGDQCYYVDEDAIAPLWRGKRFPMSSCISGWVMLNKQSAAIEDIYQDPRIPADAYRPTFVKSLVVVPIRTEAPIGAIGNYWASHHQATAEEIQVLQSLANAASIAVENIQLFSDLKHQLELRDEFISITAHELKTPLTPLMIHFQFLRKLFHAGKLESFSRKNDLEKIIDASFGQLQDFSKLIDSLLDVSKINLGKFVIELEDKISLSDVIEKVVKEYQLTQDYGIRVDLKSKIHGKWDRLKLEQVFRNLLSNAVRYGEKKPITISASLKGQGATITVADQGVGIDGVDFERIFNRFERAASIRHHGGMGLGLYICREIIRGHGGTIRVESGKGAGTRFIIDLPLQHTSLEK
jgi:signal transduction histidine kinase